MIRKILPNDIVYVILSPNNYIQENRGVKCRVKGIYHRRSTQVSSVEWQDVIPDHYRLSLVNFEDNKTIYCNKSLDKIYFEDEIDTMQQDIDNLNAILRFKQKQKEELKQYIKNEFPNWVYRSNINGI